MTKKNIEKNKKEFAVVHEAAHLEFSVTNIDYLQPYFGQGQASFYGKAIVLFPSIDFNDQLYESRHYRVPVVLRSYNSIVAEIRQYKSKTILVCDANYSLTTNNHIRAFANAYQDSHDLDASQMDKAGLIKNFGRKSITPELLNSPFSE